MGNGIASRLMRISHVARLGSVQRVASMTLAALMLFVTVATLLLFEGTARADDKSTCAGPAECCPPELTEDSKDKVAHVDIGVVLVGIYEVNEKASTWTADFYLTEKWLPLPGFSPQTEIWNEVSRSAEQFDRTVLVNGRCERQRRIHSTLHNAFNLRTFPFDRQRLSLIVSDAVYPSSRVKLEATPASSGIDDVVLQQLTAWQLTETDLSYAHSEHAFKWEEGAPNYDYGTYSVDITRHVSFHLGKFFLPLLVIVFISFSVFWIDPEDLGSAMSVGVTCLLAAVALQFTEGGSLPDVNYLTISDRAFTVCYIMIGLAVLQAVYTNRLSRDGNKEKARAFDKKCRVLFPIGLAVAMVIGVLGAFF